MECRIEGFCQNPESELSRKSETFRKSVSVLPNLEKAEILDHGHAAHVQRFDKKDFYGVRVMGYTHSRGQLAASIFFL
jgi:hypothetical protein